jgi:hypothetical protein
MNSRLSKLRVGYGWMAFENIAQGFIEHYEV